ncbi:regulator [[Bacillus] sp. KCTC 13219]|uniref:response regulator n=1 Tax=Metasolibacillus fluoroglycofenilyticus TaxID=1239396 RepID=UPI0007943A7E|nr:response regulator [Metasolibacillus fluoroglycofenilyticus]KYG91139.1 regulator [[Bacillus] sp. KCTC 13219]
MDIINVLLIEDDPMVREVNRQFIERVENFQVIGMAANGIEGLEKIRELKPALVFMDIFMPSLDGIETLRQIRQQNIKVDVISVTAANDVPTIQSILHLGVFDYIMKPFTFERMEQTLKNYRQFKRAANSSEGLTQQQLDSFMRNESATVAEPASKLDNLESLPKGLNKATLFKVLQYLKTELEGASADKVASAIGVARVTARRYLDFMEKQQLIQVEIRYGSVGRPTNHYYID